MSLLARPLRSGLRARNRLGPLGQQMDAFRRSFGLEDMLEDMLDWNAETARFAMPVPKVSCSETDKAVHVSAELPGVKKDDINVHFDQASRRLTITAETKDELEENDETKDHTFHFSDRVFGKVQRAFTLPETVTSAEGSKATFEGDGVLRLEFTKSQPSANVSKIEID